MSQTKNKKKNGRGGMILLIVVVAAVIALVMASSFLPDAPVSQPRQTTAAASTAPVETKPAPTVRVEAEEFRSINLGYGLEITDVGSYTGIYMEDGSDELVSDVMMIVVQNNGESDLQLGQITVSCGEEQFSFSVTNLSAGSRAVLLEQERRPEPDGVPASAVLENPVLFEEPMDLCADVIEIGGLDGMLNVRNISETDISGDVYVYYKYAASDLFYGGITFRVRIEGGLKAGELRQVPAVHFDPDGCAVVQVVVVE